MSFDVQTLGGVDVSRETYERLIKLSQLIQKWTKSINLIANASVPDIWERHIVDSIQVFGYAPSGWTTWTDIGSGGGLPALVVAIVDLKRRPITLIESDQRKCLFLNTARRELDLNISVQNGRIEDQNMPLADVLTARALAPLDELMAFSQKLLRHDGTAIFPKGERFQDELDRARIDWEFDVISHSSKTHPSASVLEISRIQRRER